MSNRTTREHCSLQLFAFMIKKTDTEYSESCKFDSYTDNSSRFEWQRFVQHNDYSQSLNNSRTFHL